MYCTECGVKNAVDSKFCKQCGQKMDKVRVREEDYTSALPAEEQSLELLESAYALRKKGDTSGAIQMCERALLLAPNSASIHSLLGQLYVGQGDREHAIREYERVLLLNPGSIADRLKLDELRDEGLPKKKAKTLIVGEHGNAAPSLPTLLSIGAAMLALLAVGIVISRQPHSEPANRPTGSLTATSSPVVTTPATSMTTKIPALTANSAPPASEETVKPTGETARQKTPKNVTRIAADNPPDTTPNDLPTPGATLPTIHAVDPPEVPPVLDPTPARSANQPKTKKTASKKTKSDPAKDDRIVLNNGDGKPGDSEHYTIRISTNGSETVRGNPVNAGPKNSVVVSNVGAESGNPPASEARSAISIADDLRYKGEFDKAVRMYQRALPGAGDRAGHVYHQMAYCFQARGDKTSARVNYERAIEAYQKQMASGHDGEAVQSAIRVCQRGLKICESQ